MGFLSLVKDIRVEKPKPVAASKARTFHDLVLATADEQISMLNGEKVYGTKRNKKTGEYSEKKCHLNGNVFIPKIGVKPIFETDQLTPATKEIAIQFWNAIKNYKEDPEDLAHMTKLEETIKSEKEKSKQTRSRNSKSYFTNPPTHDEGIED